MLMEDNLNAWFDTYMFAFIRVSAMIAAAPLISKPYVSPRIQAVLALGITALIIPTLTDVVSVTLFSLPGLMIALQQVLLGISMGFILNIVFEVFTLAGQFMAMQSGLGYAMVVDPQRGTQVAVIGQIFLITASLFFIVSNGHLTFIRMIGDSFTYVPIESYLLTPEHFLSLGKLGSQMFIGGVNIAIPAVTALLLLNFALAMMNRAAPQLHLFTIGFPLMLLVGLFSIYVTYSVTFNHTEDLFSDGFKTMTTWLSRH